MREISSPLDGFASPFGPQRGFNPLRIFANDEPGVWFEANDSTTLFTDVAGTTPVTTPGDAVALQLDKSHGLTLGPEEPNSGLQTGWASDDPRWTFLPDSISWAGGGSGSSSTFKINFLDTSARTRFVELRFTVSGHSGSSNFGFEANTLSASPTATVGIDTRVSANGNYVFRGYWLGGGDGRSLAILGRPEAAWTLSNVSVKELPGNHRTQATTAARPLYALHPVGGVRNTLYSTHDFETSISNRFLERATAENITDDVPSVASEAVRMSETTADGGHSVYYIGNLSGQRVLSVYAKAGTRRRVILGATSASGLPSSGWAVFDLVSGTVVNSANGTAAIEPDANGWYRLTFSTTIFDRWVFAIAQDTDTSPVGYVGDTSKNVLFAAPQLEPGSTATNYQKVRSFLDVSEEGKARRGRLWYNGTSHFMQTGTITPGTDKVQVFAGVRKLSDAAAGILIESSTISETSNGAFGIAAPGSSAKFIAISRGTIIRTAGTTDAAYNAPTTRVVSTFGDISGDRVALHIDGTQVAQSTGSQGTGNFLAYPIYFGARGGTSLFFNGYEDTSIIRFGPNLDASVIGKVESYVASKTPEPTL